MGVSPWSDVHLASLVPGADDQPPATHRCQSAGPPPRGCQLQRADRVAVFVQLRRSFMGQRRQACGIQLRRLSPRIGVKKEGVASVEVTASNGPVCQADLRHLL